MDDLEFQRRADAELEKLYRALNRAAEEHELEADFNSGALSIEFEDPPAKFVISPNAPVRQVWVSAHVQSFKLDWSDQAQAFVLTDGRTLRALIQDCVRKQLGEDVTL